MTEWPVGRLRRSLNARTSLLRKQPFVVTVPKTTRTPPVVPMRKTQFHIKPPGSSPETSSVDAHANSQVRSTKTKLSLVNLALRIGKKYVSVRAGEGGSSLQRRSGGVLAWLDRPAVREKHLSTEDQPKRAVFGHPRWQCTVLSLPIVATTGGHDRPRGVAGFRRPTLPFTIGRCCDRRLRNQPREPT